MSYGHVKLLGRFVSVALVALRVKVAIMRIRNDLLSSMKLGLEETPSGPSGWWQKRLRRWWWTKREGHGTAILIAGAQLMPRHSFKLSPVTCHVSFTLFFSFTELSLAPHSNNRILSSDSLVRDMDFPPFDTICETQARPTCTSHDAGARASARCHRHGSTAPVERVPCPFRQPYFCPRRRPLKNGRHGCRDGSTARLANLRVTLGRKTAPDFMQPTASS
jgi:hypothetical protein